MAFTSIATGLQHIGVPTNDIERTIAFYTALGFQVAERFVPVQRPVEVPQGGWFVRGNSPVTLPLVVERIQS